MSLAPPNCFWELVCVRVGKTVNEKALVSNAVLCKLDGALLGIWFAWGRYTRFKEGDRKDSDASAVYQAMEHKWYVDEIYDALIVKPIYRLSELLWKFFDVQVIDRIVVGFGRVSLWSGETARVMQTGSIQVYALMLLVGLIATAGYLIYVWV